MKTPPEYFERIRARAAKRWEQLENDPELAGPWHQLFRQVQSPRHILSELLQNAEDAKATVASVNIENERFTFIHNGEDFSEENFASLCRFGYSDKRELHTIGFRGIGFKSTFSLGDIVELHSPTLSVSFHRKRFTEPKWTAAQASSNGLTEISAAISDADRRREVEQNLLDWLSDPVSLLLFENIRLLRVGTHEVKWESLGHGSVAGSEWMALNGDPDQSFLLIQSQPEPFPEEALSEIRDERLLGNDPDTTFPPCRVKLVLGAKGRLYVVLPTGVETNLPFACDAPFIQDPARLRIKDPETSPTNRWLLDRIGALAADAMLQWLREEGGSLKERSGAYGLYPGASVGTSLEANCAAIVNAAFNRAIADKPLLLTNGGDLQFAKESVIVPAELLDVWPADQAASLLDDEERPAFSRHVSEADSLKLIQAGLINRIGLNQVIETLKTKHLPRPPGWPALLKLWAYVAPAATGYLNQVNAPTLRLIPVQGKDVLYAGKEVVRLGERKLLQSDSDWEFLDAHLLVLNQNWPRFLAEQRRVDAEPNEAVEASFAILPAVGLEDASDVSTVINRVAGEFFKQESVSLAQCVQLAHIAAKLGATPNEAFQFATQDRKRRTNDRIILFDATGTIEALFPHEWNQAHLLHPEYSRAFESCSPEEWQRWVSSGRAGLHEFVPLNQSRASLWGRQPLEAELRRRGLGGAPYYPYVTNNFLIEDWDFEQSHWKYWDELAKDDNNLWTRLTEVVLSQPSAFWSKATKAAAFQIATTGSRQSVTSEQLLPGWILRLRNLSCLPDTRGFHHLPADLLRRTAETESLIDVEPFVHARLDVEANRPLLRLLGVGAVPTGPDRLLDRLRALAGAQQPPLSEVEKWYRRLDQLVETCSTSDFAKIKTAFHQEKLIITDTAGWATAATVFLSASEEDVPGAPVVRASVRDLTLWTKIEVAEHPTPDLAIKWLAELPIGKALSPDDVRRVRALLPRYATRIWTECEHWLNLAGEWVPIDNLEYSLSMQSLVPWNHLLPWVKQQTADLQRLPSGIAEDLPFSNLPRLANSIENRLLNPPLELEQIARRPWLNQLGSLLQRIQLDDELETSRTRALGADLAETSWCVSPALEILPYIDGTPAGTAKSVDLLWLERVLYVAPLPEAKLARLVPEELGRSFARADVTAALNYCYDRSSSQVTQYMEENFSLAPAEPAKAPTEALVPTEKPQPLEAETIGPTESEEGIAEEQATTQELGSLPAGDDEAEDDDTPSEDPEPSSPRARANAGPRKPSIIERFAHAHGFQNDGDERFYHSDGSWIGKTHGEVFPWERKTATGELVKKYWPKDHCLERDPLQLEADVWGLLEKFPDLYALILSNLQEDAVEVTGERLCSMREGGEMTLYPATYRLVVAHEH